MTTAGDVCAVLVTRGDVDLGPIIDTLPYDELVIWDNSKKEVDHKLFGRYRALLETTAPVIYFQDDDCLVRNHDELMKAYKPGRVVGNFRADPPRERYYHDTTLLGWGSLFDRNLPFEGLFKYARYYTVDWAFLSGLSFEFTWPILAPETYKVMVTPEWLEEDGQPIFARGNRMSQQPGFYEEIEGALTRARVVKERWAHDAR